METSAQKPESGRAYALAWFVLLLLTALSFGAHYVELGAFATAVSLAIAAVKASIVMWVFMHLGHEPVTIRSVALASVLWVLLISAGIALDIAAH